MALVDGLAIVAAPHSRSKFTPRRDEGTPVN